MLDITLFFKWLFGAFGDLFGLLNSIRFTLYGQSVSFLSVMVVFLIITMICSVLFRGAKA